MRNWALENRVSLKQTNYTMKADPKRAGGRRQYFLNLRPRILARYRTRSAGNFNLIVIGDVNTETDYFVIPYALIREVLTPDTLSTQGHGGTRWLVQIHDNSFVVFPGDRQRLQVAIPG